MKEISLYIHIPFCNGKCPYCDFYSINLTENSILEYTGRLIDTIKEFSNKYKYIIKTIYFGGGTPSAIPTDNLIKILNTIKNYFLVKENAEITIECNPVSNIDFKPLHQAGFNRLSIGMQSANEYELKILGRKHTNIDVINTVQSARNAGFKNISLDLMICLPDQKKEDISNSIKFCHSLRVEHISSYILKIEKNTQFYKMGEKLNVPNDDIQAELYEYTVNTLKEYNYSQYEISNFSIPGYESRHNLTYWYDEEYIGLGPAAHSFIDGKRFHYERDLNKFYSGNVIYDGNGGDIFEYIMLNLRLNSGINLLNCEKKFNYKFNNRFYKELELLKKSSYLNYINDNISLTTKGFLVSNSIISKLLDNIY